MSEVIEARNIKLNVDASGWRDSMVKSGQLLVDSDYITKDYIDLTIKCVEENGPYIVIIVLTLAATDDTSHLQKLQSMAEFISDEENIEFIKNAKSAEEVAKAINEFEPEE